MCVLCLYAQSTFLAAVAFPACGLLVALLKLEESKQILAIPRSLLKDIAKTGVSKLLQQHAPKIIFIVCVYYYLYLAALTVRNLHCMPALNRIVCNVQFTVIIADCARPRLSWDKIQLAYFITGSNSLRVHAVMLV
jgi:hypothetical protein